MVPVLLLLPIPNQTTTHKSKLYHHQMLLLLPIPNQTTTPYLSPCVSSGCYYFQFLIKPQQYRLYLLWLARCYYFQFLIKPQHTIPVKLNT